MLNSNIIRLLELDVTFNMVCSDCGEPLICSHCDLPMVHHDMFGLAWCPKIYWGEEFEGSHGVSDTELAKAQMKAIDTQIKLLHEIRDDGA